MSNYEERNINISLLQGLNGMEMGQTSNPLKGMLKKEFSELRAHLVECRDTHNSLLLQRIAQAEAERQAAQESITRRMKIDSILD